MAMRCFPDMANVEVATMPFPFSLGKVFPGAAFAAASAPLTQNSTPTEHGRAVRMFNGIFIYSWPGNATTPSNGAPLYICNTAAAPDLVNFTNVIAVLQPGDTFPRSKEWALNRDIGTLFIGAENATDFALVSIDSF